VAGAAKGFQGLHAVTGGGPRVPQSSNRGGFQDPAEWARHRHQDCPWRDGDCVIRVAQRLQTDADTEKGGRVPSGFTQRPPFFIHLLCPAFPPLRLRKLWSAVFAPSTRPSLSRLWGWKRLTSRGPCRRGGRRKATKGRLCRGPEGNRRGDRPWQPRRSQPIHCRRRRPLAAPGQRLRRARWVLGGGLGAGFAGAGGWRPGHRQGPTLLLQAPR